MIIKSIKSFSNYIENYSVDYSGFAELGILQSLDITLHLFLYND